MSETTDRYERLMALVQKTAMLALDMTPVERERYLVEKQVQYLDDAKSTGAPDSMAQEWADNMDNWVRGMITIVEQSGGADGGNV